MPNKKRNRKKKNTRKNDNPLDKVDEPIEEVKPVENEQPEKVEEEEEDEEEQNVQSKGSGLGGPPANKGSGLGGPPPKSGSGLGGPPKSGSGLGGPPKSGSGLGGPPKSGSGLGGPPANKGSGLGGPPPKSGSGLGGPPPKSGSGLGGPPKSGSGLGGPPANKGSGLGGPPPKSGSGLGGPPKSGSGLGGPPKSGSGLGGPPPKSGSGLGGPPSANKKEEKKEKKEEKEPENENNNEEGGKKKKKRNRKKKGGKQVPKVNKKIAEKIKKQKEEEERLRLLQEEEERKELERIKQEEEEEKLKQIEIEKKRQKNREKQKRRKQNQKNKQRQNALSRLGNEYNVNKDKKKEEAKKKKEEERKMKEKEEEERKMKEEEERKKKEEEEEESEDEIDNWEDLADSDDEDNLKGLEEKEEEKEEEEEKEDVTKGEETKSESNNNNDEEDTEILRSPICCVLGHVDTGKTKLLDRLRKSNVQGGEAGGITQQIGATYVPLEHIKKETKKLSNLYNIQYQIPGLLIIDTPGHEAFSNLRKRGSSLCNIAILVVDIQHGLEPQTIESLRLLRSRKTPFIVAVNKIDTLYDWKPSPNAPFRETFKQQPKHTKREFEEKFQHVKTQFAEQEFNSEIYDRNKQIKKYISLVPTSAITGEGLPDLLALILQFSQKLLRKEFILSENLQCTVLEVKKVDGLGTTIDVILADGTLNVGDDILLTGLNGAIQTKIRALLTPEPLKEIRIKSPYKKHKSIRAAEGIKISAQNLEHAIAGSNLIVLKPGDDVEAAKIAIQKDLKNMLNIKKTNENGLGVYVQASSLGSLEALLEFLETAEIPVSHVSIGDVHRKDVMKASTMLEKDPTYGCILAFDVKISNDVQAEADKRGVRIFARDIIYNLENDFIDYMDEIKQKKIDSVKNEAVFPVKMQILEQHIFNKKNPIVLGVYIKKGSLRLNTPICADLTSRGKDPLYLGRVVSIEENRKQIEEATEGREVAIKIEMDIDETQPGYDHKFDHTDYLISKITRRSIDVLKQYFVSDLTKSDKVLIARFKKIFDIL